jgi:hypothetical protein
MWKSTFARLMNPVLQVARRGREGWQPAKPAKRKGPGRRPALEQLEDRCLPSTLQPISLSLLTPPPSNTAAGASDSPSVSANGEFVAFESRAANLVPNQVSVAGAENVFLLDRATGKTRLVSHLPDQPTTAPSTAGKEFPSYSPLISKDGNFIVYGSESPEFASGLAPFDSVVMLYDVQKDQNILVSHSSASPTAAPAGFQGGAAVSEPDAISMDGTYVLFTSYGTDLVPGQRPSPTNPNETHQLFEYHRTSGASTSGTIQLVSHRAVGLNLGSTTTLDNDGVDTGDIAPNGKVDYARVGTASVADNGMVAYVDSSTDVVNNFMGTAFDVYLYDPTSQANKLVSFDPTDPSHQSGAGGLHFGAVISGDASTVAYVSNDNVVFGQSGTQEDNVFSYSVAGDANTLVSAHAGSTTMGANDRSGAGGVSLAVSHDGRFIAFTSQATDLIRNQSGQGGNVFRYDSHSPGLTLLSGRAGSPTEGAGGVPDLLPGGIDGDPRSPDVVADPITGAEFVAGPQVLSMSDDGSLVAYVSNAGDVVPGQHDAPSGEYDVYLAGPSGTTLVTGTGGSATATADGESSFPVLSGMGNLLAFHSLATDLLARPFFDGNGVADVFTYTPGGQGVSLVSGAGSHDEHPGSSFATSVSEDGRYTVFTSNATNLVGNQVTVNSQQNIFLYDKQAPQDRAITLVNHAFGTTNTTGDGGVHPDFFPAADTTVRPLDFVQPVISADGSTIAFASFDDNLVSKEVIPRDELTQPFSPGPVQEFIYLYHLKSGPWGDAGTITLVNHAAGVPAQVEAPKFEYPPGSHHFVYFDSFQPAISANGQYVAFAFGEPGDFGVGVELYSQASDTTTPIASYTDLYPNLPVVPRNPTISDDGRFVAYQSAADGSSISVYDRNSGSSTLVTSAGSSAVISHDGSYIAFVSAARNLVSGQTPSGAAGLTNVFLYKNDGSGAISLVSGVGGSASVTGNGNSDSPAIDSDGSAVAYRSDATNLISGQSGAGSNIFEFQRGKASQTLVSHQAGAPNTAAAGDSRQPVIDDDGHLITYVSTAGNLIPGQSGTPSKKNVYIWLRTTDANILVSGQDGSPTVTGDDDSDGPLLTRHSNPLFSSKATDLQKSGLGGTSVAWINTLVELVLSPSTVADGTGANVFVGNWTVSSLLPQEYQLVSYTLPPDQDDNAVFSAGNGTLTTGIGFLANYASGKSYQVSLHIDIGFGDSSGLLTVHVAVPVTISPVANQPGGSAVHFTVSFGAPVGDFGPQDVLLGGNTGATQKEVSGSGTTYTVTVRGMNQEGDITITIPAGQVHDGNGTANQAGTTQVHYQPNNPPDHLFAVATDIAHSDESYRRFVAGKYKTILMRDPDQEGLDAWVQRMLHDPVHYTDELVEANFLNSVEYVSRHHGIGHDWVLGMYHDLLGRTNVGEDEIAGWLGRLAAGTSPLEVATEISGSVERESERVEGDYETYLGRHGDQVGNYVAGFARGLTNEDILSLFVGSPEYYFRGNKGADDPATWVRQAYQDLLGRAAGDDEVQMRLRELS